ncbi:hypothetical protein HY523_02800 [Candidatus Berkelbacteria bacterium]|nr:hypothetical protein [Candidatus Berkelbacteria bacterium]
MQQPNIDILTTFTTESIPDLDVAVLGALELFQTKPLPKLDLTAYRRPLVVGSGNAEATGRIIFEDSDAVFASESTFEAKLQSIPAIDGVILVSASGEKHAPIIEKCAQQYGKHVTLLTNSCDSSASQGLDHQHPYDEYVFPKNREPYTYNTSTYLGMILGHTQEDPASIDHFLRESMSGIDLSRLANYEKYFLIVPPQLAGIIRMLQVKFIELFGRMIARDVETSEYMKHAVTVVPADELFISFGEENTTWGTPANRLHIPLPKEADYGAMLAIGYFVIGQIQKQHRPYFKEHLVDYTKQASQIFGTSITPIVE